MSSKKTFFDINNSNVSDLYDIIDIENNLNYINDAKYNKRMKELRKKIDDNDDNCVIHLARLLNEVYPYELNVEDIDNNKDIIKQFLFTKKSAGSESVVISSDIITPTA